MPCGLKTLIRNRQLKKHSNSAGLCFLPLDKIRTAVVLTSCPEEESEALGRIIRDFFSGHSINVTVFNIDTGKDAAVPGNPELTFTSEDINWFGMPDLRKADPIIGQESDLFISLSDKQEFTDIFLSHCAKARFKIGTSPYRNHNFNMIVTGNDDSTSNETKFKTVTGLLNLIK